MNKLTDKEKLLEAVIVWAMVIILVLIFFT